MFRNITAAALLMVLLFAAGMLPAGAEGSDAMRWVTPEYPCAYYLGEDGEPAGFLYEIAREALVNRLGIELRVDFMPWVRCQNLVESGQADMMLTTPTPGRLEYTVTTESPVWIKTRLLLARKNRPDLDVIRRITSVEDIKAGNYTVVSYIGSDWVKSNIEAAGVKVVYSTTIDGMYYMLAGGRGDLVVEDAQLSLAAVGKLELDDDFVKIESEGFSSGFYIMIGRKSGYAGIIGRLEQIIREMQNDGTISRILSAYGL